MSVITLPGRVDAPRRRLPAPTARPPAHRAGAPRRNAIRSVWRGSSAARKSGVIIFIALALSITGSMVVANRQVQLHELQSQLLQVESNYAMQVGTLTNEAAPAQIASKAGALRLVDPVTIIQVLSTSLDAPLPLPKFSGYAPDTSRTSR